MAFGDPVVQKVDSGADRTEGEVVVAVEQNGGFQSTDDRGVGEPVPVTTISDKYKDRFDFAT